jgi:hypothetical protein
LIARLLSRHAEASRDVVAPMRDPLTPALRDRADDASVGMPLGLPPLRVSQIRVLYTWIGQGARP